MTISATLSLDEATRRKWAVLVVGAGPAGALAARGLARCGVATLLVDRAAFPRGKVCGCCLNGRALAVLDAAGLGDLTARCGAVRLTAVELAARGRSAQVRLGGSVALSREEFDAALVRAAVEAGAAFLPRTRAVLPSEPAGETRTVSLHLGDATAPVGARCVLAADGLGGTLLARSDLGATAAPGARIGAGVVVAEPPAWYRPGIVYMACGTGGYLGLVRVEDGRLNLAAAFDAAHVRVAGGLGQAASGLLGEVGWPLPEHLAAAGWRGTPALTRQAPRLAAERLFVLGDAAGYVEPFTGEGIAWALAAAAAVVPLAARAAERWHPSLAAHWANVYRGVVGRRLACRAAAAVLRHPLLAAALIRILTYAPALAGPFVRHLNRVEKPAFG
jgi:flavin-dependent dehydrogenase